MKGFVTIYEIVEGVHKELACGPNLVVDGAGEHIVDILSTNFLEPEDYQNSSVLSSVSGLLDTSNFVVQAASFGNSYGAYGSNLLAYKKHNFAPNSSSLSGTGWKTSNVSSDGSGLFTVTNTTGNALVQLSSIGPYISSSLSSIAPMTASVDVKFNFDNPIEQNSETLKRYTSIQLLHWGASATVNLEWDNEGVPSFTDSYQEGFIKDMLGGWYRVSLRTSTDLSAVIPFVTYAQERIILNIYPTGTRSVLEDVSNTTPFVGGSLYIKNPSVNLGSIPINYHVTTGDSFYSYEDDVLEYPLLASSLVCASACGVILINSNGTVTNDASSYNEIFDLPEDPNPLDTKLQSNTETPYSEQTALKVNLGHNVNFSLWEGKEVSSTEFLDYLEEDWSYGSSILSSLVREDIRLYSSYAPSSASGWDYILVSSIDSYDDPIVTFSIDVTSVEQQRNSNAVPDSEGTSRCINHEGYIRVANASAVNSGIFEFPGNLQTTSNDFFVSATYETSPSAGVLLFNYKTPSLDSKWMSMTGGVQTIGIYVIDFKEMMRKGYIFPFDFESKEQPPIYKLFAKKVFHYPLGHTGDLISSSWSGWSTLSGPRAFRWRITL